ncbi:MAG: NAD-dependent dehydratase [Acidobacteria bacterium]|nr:MAG: NAD-dependent dehydratase [Acidobacteriota bacterium]
MRILIIGGTRFIGPYVVQRLANEGHDITIFHRGETEADSRVRVQEIHGDRRELSSFVAEFKTVKPDVVLDMIAYTEEDARNLYPHRAHAKGQDDFAYNYEKILVERVVMSDAALPFTILRLPAVYGPNDSQHRLFGYLKRMDDRRPAILLEEEQSRWRWTRGYVQNVADAIALAVTDNRAMNRIYNVGEPEALSESDWVHAIGHAAGWDGRIVVLPKDSMPAHMTTNADYSHHLFTDTNRIRAELGFNEQVSRQESLHKTIDWERANPPAEPFPAESEYAAEDAILAKLKID